MAILTGCLASYSHCINVAIGLTNVMKLLSLGKVLQLLVSHK